MRTEPMVLTDVISLTSAIWLRWRSKGVATVVATTSGLAPGSCATTEMVGKSTWGNGATGSWKNATAPAAATPKVSRIVATGRLMNGVDGLRIFLGVLPSIPGVPAAPVTETSLIVVLPLERIFPRRPVDPAARFFRQTLHITLIARKVNARRFRSSHAHTKLSES
jgi:hypothetical protein